LFINIFIFILWCISKEALERLENKENLEKDKLIHLLDEVKELAKDILSAYEGYLNKYDKNEEHKL
jgi:type III secretory pathway component EscR